MLYCKAFGCDYRAHNRATLVWHIKEAHGLAPVVVTLSDRVLADVEEAVRLGERREAA